MAEVADGFEFVMLVASLCVCVCGGGEGAVGEERGVQEVCDSRK